jgi:hypothetical protein
MSYPSDLITLDTLGASLLGGVLLQRTHQQRQADATRRTYVATYPRDVAHVGVLNFFRGLSGLPKPSLLSPVHAVVFEAYADETGIKHFVSIPGHVVADVEGQLRTHVAGAALTPLEAERDPVARTAWTHATEYGTSAAHVPLRIEAPEAIIATILSNFHPLKPGQAVVMQWVVTPTRGTPPSASNPTSLSWPLPLGQVDYSQHKEKNRDRLFLATVRIAARGEDAASLVRRIYSGLASTHAHGMRFRPLVSARGRLVQRVQERRSPVVFRAHVNALELSALVAIPAGGPNVPGLPQGRTRYLAPDHSVPRQGLVLGAANFPGAERPLAVTPESLFQHMWLVGPTGVGKSTVLHNLCPQIMEGGHGLVLVEPKGDLAQDVLSTVPESRREDVIWFDPTDRDRPIGLNVLAGPDPERTAGYITGLMKSLYSDSWGPRLEQILRHALLTAASAGLTLYDVKQLLVNPGFRGRIVSGIHDYDLVQFWGRLEQGPDNVVDSVVNKLDGFVGSRAIRNIVGQTEGLDVGSVVRDSKIMLVPLPSAVLGEANAAMLGSLLVSQLWQQIRLREHGHRPPTFLVLDEFQNFLNLSISVEDAFAQARSYRLGLIVANQHTGQFGTSVLSAVMNNARTKMAFGVSSQDAGKLREQFAPLSAYELQALGQYEVALQVMTPTGLAPVITARTAPPPPVSGIGDIARANSRARHGTDAVEVERQMRSRHRGKAAASGPPLIGEEDE